MLFVAALAIISLVLLPGLGLSRTGLLKYLDYFILSSFILSSIVRLVIAREKVRYLKDNPVEYIFVFLFISFILIFRLLFTQTNFQILLSHLHITSLTNVFIVLTQGYILLSLISELGRANTRYFNLPLPPAALFVLSFLIVIAIGTLLLMLPGAKNWPERGQPEDASLTAQIVPEGLPVGKQPPKPSSWSDVKYKKPIRFIDALFTATSATCVTGLIVLPTGSYFSRFGHSVILVLIQLGGLGLMTFATFFALILRREFSMRHRVLLGDILDYEVFSRIKSILTGIILLTIFFELAGAILLYLNMRGRLAGGEEVFFSVFHSISAFCNAGFSLVDANLEPYKFDRFMNIVVGLLIVFGGLGFVVLIDIFRFFRRLPSEFMLKKPRFSLQTKVVLTTSFVLIVLGAVFIFAIEGGGDLLGYDILDKTIAAFFHSITTRTAGFNTIPIGAFSPAVILLMMALMFIGASPGSTGGGIKTTTFASLYVLFRARMTGREDIPVFDRALPLEMIRDAVIILLLAIGLVFTGTVVLLITEKASFLHLLFEQISAFATVGLSCGVTPELTDAGKIVIIVTMFLGRVGPLTFLFAMSGRRKALRIRNLEEKIMIG